MHYTKTFTKRKGRTMLQRELSPNKTGHVLVNNIIVY